MPCGTRASFKRGCRCEPCADASRAYTAGYRAKAGIRPRTSMTTQEIIHEIEFLLNAGEGTHRIITALGYLGKEQSLKSRLYRAGRTDLTNRILRMEEQAAA